MHFCRGCLSSWCESSFSKLCVCVCVDVMLLRLLYYFSFYFWNSWVFNWSSTSWNTMFRKVFYVFPSSMLSTYCFGEVIHLLSKYLLRTYHVPETLLGPGIQHWTSKILIFIREKILWWKYSRWRLFTPLGKKGRAGEGRLQWKEKWFSGVFL